MIITCEECNTSYNLSASLLKPSGNKVRCTTCKHVFTAFPPPEEAPVMVKAEPVADTQIDTLPSQPFAESEKLDADDLFELDEEDNFGEATAMDAGDGDDFDLAGEDFNLPGNDLDSIEEKEPTEADLKLTEEDLDLVMNYVPPETKAAVAEPARQANGDAAQTVADRGELDELLEDNPAEADAGTATHAVAETDLDLDLDFDEDAETEALETPPAPAAPDLEGADELDLDLDLDLDMEEEETAADSDASADEATLSLDENAELADGLNLDDDGDNETTAEMVSDDELATDDDIDFENLDLELEIDTQDAPVDTDEATPPGRDPELALELEEDGSNEIREAGEIENDLDLDLELDLEDDADKGSGLEGDDELSLELDNFDQMTEDSAVDADPSTDEPELDLEGDFELALDDDAKAADTAAAGGSEEDDFDLADLEGILDEDGADDTKAPSEKVSSNEEALLGDDDLGLTNELESILDEDEDDSETSFSLDEEPELDLDLENPDTAAVDDDSLDLSDFEYLAEDGEKAPSDAHFDSGDMELEFEVDEESASALEEADAGFSPPSEPAEKPVEPKIVPEPDASAKPPAGPAPVRKKRRTSKLLIAVLIIVLLLGGGYCAYVLLDGMGIRIPYLSDYLKPEANDPGNLQMTTFDINSRFVDSQALGRIFVITGKVKNGYDHPRGFVQLTGKLFTKGKNLSSSQTVYAGNLISDMDLVNLNAEELKKRLNNRFGNNRINSRVQPGKSLPFMVVFTELPEAQLEEFTIEVDASTALK